MSPAAAPTMDLLRLSTAGSVDDGKSTLIGRLLYDTKSIFEDQLRAVEDASRRRGETGLNLALLTDGLRAEREQNITIDVAYRYFATPKRKFIIADTPGHTQYTRNMVTGASTAEMAIVLVDARRGVLTQSRRHGFIASLLRIPHVLVAVNKMDLVDFDEAVFDAIQAEYEAFAEKLDVKDLIFVPMSALHGDNVVTKSERMPWYNGGTLLHYLESVNVGAGKNLLDFRFPVQHVIRPHQDFRGFAGRIASGTITPGEEVVVMGSGQTTRIRSIETADGPLSEASAHDCVVLTLEDDVDVGRGDMIVRRMNVPLAAERLEAMVCWMHEDALVPGKEYLLMHTTRSVRARVESLIYRIDVDTLHRQDASELGLNDIGRVRLHTAKPLFFDPYQTNRETGGFIIIDPYANVTVGAGMIRGEVLSPVAPTIQVVEGRPASPGVVREGMNIALAEREVRSGHKAAVVWLTGLSGSGKSTTARALERELFERGCSTMLLEGDHVRHGLCGDLGFSAAERRENIRRVGEVARLFFDQGTLVICAFVSPFAEDRARARALLPEGRFFEVFIDCDVEECRRRDPKGLYAQAAAGEVTEMTGVSAPYEAPREPELVLHTDTEDVATCVQRLLELLVERGIVAQHLTR
ncbi:MAG: sulfate adenylyltransferase subunit CysN [Longimicrobiales bacterium]